MSDFTSLPSKVSKVSASSLGQMFARISSTCDECEVRERSFCNVLEAQEIARLAAIVASRSYGARQTIVQEGDQADFLLNIVSGTVKLYRSLPDGRVQIVGFLGEGDFLGVPAARCYAVSAEAVTPTQMCVFPRRSFERVLDECPALERRLFELAKTEVAAARDHMLLLGRKTARERVASFLVGTVDKARCARETSHCITLPMARTEIADYLGLTMETVSRTITSLRNEGLIAVQSPGHVDVLRPDTLRPIANGEE